MTRDDDKPLLLAEFSPAQAGSGKQCSGLTSSHQQLMAGESQSFNNTTVFGTSTSSQSVKSDGKGGKFMHFTHQWTLIYAMFAGLDGKKLHTKFA